MGFGGHLPDGVGATEFTALVFGEIEGVADGCELGDAGELSRFDQLHGLAVSLPEMFFGRAGDEINEIDAVARRYDLQWVATGLARHDVGEQGSTVYRSVASPKFGTVFPIVGGEIDVAIQHR